MTLFENTYTGARGLITAISLACMLIAGFILILFGSSKEQRFGPATDMAAGVAHADAPSCGDSGSGDSGGCGGDSGCGK